MAVKTTLSVLTKTGEAPCEQNHQNRSAPMNKAVVKKQLSKHSYLSPARRGTKGALLLIQKLLFSA